MQFQLHHKETFTNQLRDIPLRFWPQIIEKAETLRNEPRPDGSSRKKLKKYEGNICRIRSGDYRIVYTYGDGWVELIGVDDRADVYDEEVYSGSGIGRTGEGGELVEREFVFGDKPETRQVEYLPRVIDEELLTRHKVPPDLFPVLTACKTVDDLSEANVPAQIRDLLFDVVMDTNYDEVLSRPSYVTGDTHDLIRYVEGELLGFLLKLDPAQEAVVDWGMKGTGPTLVKGGPGTGKSTIALYRVKVILEALKASGVPRPRILFTTYTHALVASSKQLLGRLLGDDARFVEVRTADSVVSGVLDSLGLRLDVVRGARLRDALKLAFYPIDYEYGASAHSTFARLGADYILEEIASVIEAREISSFEEYEKAPRAGRRVPLTSHQRLIVWGIYEELTKVLDERGQATWEGLRSYAAQAMRAGAGPKPYDGVVVDEAQDLDPTVLRVLVALCARPNRLFITADANQSIYGSTFRWSDVHEDLRVQGRTVALRTNYRSTREVGQAAASYLLSGALEPGEIEQTYVVSGPKPAVRRVGNEGEEIELLVEFLREAARFWRLGLDSSAVLTPTGEVGKELAFRLSEARIPSEFMAGRSLDLGKRVVKVITLHSAKGLEFPIVAIAGFTRAPNYSMHANSTEEREERLAKARRGMFVGMTRAMRALFVAVPANARNPLLEGFAAELWNTGAKTPAEAGE